MCFWKYFFFDHKGTLRKIESRVIRRQIRSRIMVPPPG
jgi:hypothetical protein